MILQTTALFLVCNKHEGVCLVIAWDDTDPGNLLPVSAALNSDITGGFTWISTKHGTNFRLFTDRGQAERHNMEVHG